MMRNNDCVVMVSTALRVTPLYVAEIVTSPAADGLIVALNAPDELKAGTRTLAGTVASPVLLLDSVTKAPPTGVSAVNQIVTLVLVVPV
jgi:hypothetical protein